MVFFLPPSDAKTTNFFLPYPGSPLRIRLGEFTLVGLPLATLFDHLLSGLLRISFSRRFAFCAVTEFFLTYHWHNICPFLCRFCLSGLSELCGSRTESSNFSILFLLNLHLTLLHVCLNTLLQSRILLCLLLNIRL